MLNTRLTTAFLLLFACIAASAAVPTEFRVSDDGNAFYPAQPLRKGDRLQVLSPYLIGHDSLFLMRCVDDCRRSEIVRSWTWIWVRRTAAAPVAIAAAEPTASAS